MTTRNYTFIFLPWAFYKPINVNGSLSQQVFSVKIQTAPNKPGTQKFKFVIQIPEQIKTTTMHVIAMLIEYIAYKTS